MSSVGGVWEGWFSNAGQREWEKLGLALCEMVGKREMEEGRLTCCLRKGISR